MYVRRDTLEHNNRDDWANVKRIAEYLKAYRGRALFALLCLIVAKWANIGIPLVLRDLVDNFDKSHQVLVLPISLLLAYGALKLANSLFSELRDTVFARVRYHAMRQLSNQVLAHLHTLSLRFHLERKTGAISRDLERGTRSVSTMMNFMVFSFIPIFVEFSLVAIILLANYDGIFALITFGTIIVYGLFTVAISNWRINYRHSMNRLDSEANTQAFDSLINYETVKYFNNEKLELDRYDNTLAEWEGMAVKSQTSMSMLNFGQSAIIAIGVTIIMFFAANQVVDGSMSIGDLVMVNAFMLQLFIPLGALGMIYRQFKYTLADMDLVFKLLSQTPEIRDVGEPEALSVKRGEVVFDNVHFAYQGDRTILQGINFTVPAGKTVAVVGHSGAGKSTLARLLFRFYDVTSGRVLIDGKDVKAVS
ncbi:MAG: ABC transporter transmembrane domain-containing protein, partial [Leucothrix sp.]